LSPKPVFDCEDASVPMFQDQSQPDNHLERSGDARLLASADPDVQRKRMLIALGILLVALGAVIVKDWDFWFPSKADTPEAAALRKSKAVAEAPSEPAAAGKERKAAAAPATLGAATEAPFAATTERTALPPLQVEVVAGNQHVSVPGKSNAIHLDVGPGAGSPMQNATVSAADRVQLSPQTQQSVSVSVPPDYPLLARQMKVQGAVSLQALIARDGTIQELRILSGPEILAAAAREAVKQWHFKPYLQGGQPVETQAKITVNFTISTN
jgi:TonB family protein